MTNNALKIIKDELERINSSNEEKFNDRDANGNGFEDYYIVDKDKDMLSKALSVAAEALESISQAIHSNNYKYREATDSLTTIANILSGGKDGK